MSPPSASHGDPAGSVLFSNTHEDIAEHRLSGVMQMRLDSMTDPDPPAALQGMKSSSAGAAGTLQLGPETVLGGAAVRAMSWGATEAILVLVIVLYVGVRLWALNLFCIGSDDEYFTMWAVKGSWAEMMDWVVKDLVHPPFFYVLLKLWILLGSKTLAWISLFPYVFSIASIVPFLLLCRELNVRPWGRNLALALMAVNWYLIGYAHFLRMYSLIQFLSLCSLWLFVKYLRQADAGVQQWLALWAVNLVLVYTHYYGWMVVAAEGMFLWFWRRENIVPFSLSVAGLLLCFAPWVYAVASAAADKTTPFTDHLAWLNRPTVLEVVRYYVTLNGPLEWRKSGFAALALFGVPVLLWWWNLIATKHDRDGRDARVFALLALASFLPAVLGFAASRLLPLSVWHEKYLIIAAAPYLLLVALGVARLQSAWVRNVTMIAVLAWAGLAGYEASERELVIDWPELAKQVALMDAGKDEVRIYALDMGTALPVKFYLDWAGEQRFEVVVVRDPQKPPGNLYHWAAERGVKVVEAEDVAQLAGAHFWVVCRGRGWERERLTLQKLTDSGHVVGRVLRSWNHRQSVSLIPVWRA